MNCHLAKSRRVSHTWFGRCWHRWWGAMQQRAARHWKHCSTGVEQWFWRRPLEKLNHAPRLWFGSCRGCLQWIMVRIFREVEGSINTISWDSHTHSMFLHVTVVEFLDTATTDKHGCGQRMLTFSSLGDTGFGLFLPAAWGSLLWMSLYLLRSVHPCIPGVDVELWRRTLRI